MILTEVTPIALYYTEKSFITLVTVVNVIKIIFLISDNEES